MVAFPSTTQNVTDCVIIKKKIGMTAMLLKVFSNEDIQQDKGFFWEGMEI